MTTPDAQNCLQSLGREPRTSLQDYNNQVERLAQIAYVCVNLEDWATGPGERKGDEPTSAKPS